MPRHDPLVAALRQKLAATEKELRPLLDRRDFLRKALQEAQAIYASNGGTSSQPRRPTRVAPPRPTPPRAGSRFAQVKGGATQTLISIARGNPGLTARDLIRLAVPIAKLSASDPASSLRARLRQLLDEGRRLEMRPDGTIYARD